MLDSSPVEPNSMEILQREVEALMLVIKPRHQPSKQKTQAKGKSIPESHEITIANKTNRRG